MSDGREEREEQERRREWERQQNPEAGNVSRREHEWVPEDDWQNQRRDS